MTDFILISIPTERNPEKAFSTLNSALEKSNGISSQTVFPIPINFKVGTLDVLVGLSEDFSKLDTFAETITRKIAQYMGEVLEEQRTKLEDNLVVGGVPPSAYVQKFQWDMAKYPIKQTLQALHDIFSEQLTRIESDLRSKSMAYNNIKNSLESMERKQTGSLLTRNLAEIVKKQQFVLNSEYLTTLVMVVPKTHYEEWKACYETLVDMVIPRSTELIFEDKEHGLWTVTLFQKMVGDFCLRAKEKRFLPRDFTYDEKKIEESKNALTKLESDKKRQFPPLFRWMKINFGEAFSAMIHVKALRVFVESVLRYGLPVDFQAVLIKFNKKNLKRLREVLQKQFAHLDNLSASSIKDDELTGPGMVSVDYFPYVCVNVDTNMI